MDDEEATCAICLEPAIKDATAQHNATVLPCGHIYHCACISRWLCVAPRCPQCGFETAASERDTRERGAASVSERMNAAEVQLRAAQRIMQTNERHLHSILAMSCSSRQSDASAEGGRLRARIDDAEAAARAAGSQLREIEEELYSRVPQYGDHIGRSPRTSPRGLTTVRAAGVYMTSNPSPQYHYATNNTPSTSSRRLMTGERRAVQTTVRAAGVYSMPPTRGYLERQIRNAEQQVQAQLRVEERRVRTPMAGMVRPSRR